MAGYRQGRVPDGPFWMRFEVTSESQEDVMHLLADIRALVQCVGLILVSEQRL